MIIKVGGNLLGTSPKETDKRIIGGFNATASPQIQRAPGACGELGRLKIAEKGYGALTIPTTRAFDSVAEAEKYCVDTALIGGHEGKLLIQYETGAESSAEWAVAVPNSLKYTGVLVAAVWQIEVGKRLT